MVRRESNIKSETMLEVEKTSLIRHLDGISSFDRGFSQNDQSREILLFRYPSKKPGNA